MRLPRRRLEMILVHAFTALFTAQFLVTDASILELRTTKISPADKKSSTLSSKSSICEKKFDSFFSDR